MHPQVAVHFFGNLAVFSIRMERSGQPSKPRAQRFHWGTPMPEKTGHSSERFTNQPKNRSNSPFRPLSMGYPYGLRHPPMEAIEGLRRSSCRPLYRRPGQSYSVTHHVNVNERFDRKPSKHGRAGFSVGATRGVVRVEKYAAARIPPGADGRFK